MGTSHLLTSLQVEVATTFFGLRESSGFVVAGGAALIASDHIARPTEDLDLRLCSAIVDRLACGAAIIETGTESYRLRRSRQPHRAATG